MRKQVDAEAFELYKRSMAVVLESQSASCRQRKG